MRTNGWGESPPPIRKKIFDLVSQSQRKFMSSVCQIQEKSIVFFFFFSVFELADVAPSFYCTEHFLGTGETLSPPGSCDHPKPQLKVNREGEVNVSVQHKRSR